VGEEVQEMKKQFAGATVAVLLSIITMTGCGAVPALHQVSTTAVENSAESGTNSSLQDLSPKPAVSTSSGTMELQKSGNIRTQEQGQEQEQDQTQALAQGQKQGHGQSESATEPVQPGQSVNTSSQTANTSAGGNTGESSGNGNTAETPTGKSSGATGIAPVQEIFSVPAGEVALTIDDGPSPYTEQIISVLNQYQVKATFFFLGSQAMQYPDAVRAAVASGDEIGDHTVTHPELTHLSAAGQAEEIEQGAKDIALYDPLPITLFRPPYELMNHDTLNILAKDHMKLALWNRDPRDWDAKNPQQIVQRILQGNPSGGVFDLHDKQITLEALPAILQGLQAMHLKIVVLPA
jgi:peptidoglycan/xylan/chitin deacetylase (PgdA/CDA1 family)